MFSLEALCMNESIPSVFLSDWFFLCLFNMKIKPWCKGPVSAVCCRCASTDSPGGGVLSRQRPKLSWHNFHHWIRKEMPSLELQVPTQSWKDPEKIPKRVCISLFLTFFFFSLTVTIAENFAIFAHLCFKKLIGNVHIKENFFHYHFTKIQKHFLLVSFLKAVFTCNLNS